MAEQRAGTPGCSHSPKLPFLCPLSSCPFTGYGVFSFPKVSTLFWLCLQSHTECLWSDFCACSPGSQGRPLEGALERNRKGPKHRGLKPEKPHLMLNKTFCFLLSSVICLMALLCTDRKAKPWGSSGTSFHEKEKEGTTFPVNEIGEGAVAVASSGWFAFASSLFCFGGSSQAPLRNHSSRGCKTEPRLNPVWWPVRQKKVLPAVLSLGPPPPPPHPVVQE